MSKSLSGQARSTFGVNNIGLYPRVRTNTAGTAILSRAGAIGLVETVRAAGLDRAMSAALEPWRKPNARRDSGKILLDLALSLAVGGTGEPLAFLLREGDAGSNSAADHIAVARAAFAQLPGHRCGRRPGRSVLVRTDGAGRTHAFVDWLTGQRVQYSVGFTLPDSFTAQLAVLDRADVWRPALDAEQQIRPDALVADATGLLDLTAWPKGMRVIVRKEKPPSRRATSDHRR